MTDDADELDQRLARLFEEGRRREDPEDHPSPEKLSAYQANELPPEEADEIQEHLTECSLCAELLLDLQRFLEPEEEDRPREGVADFGAEAGWRELREKVEWKREKEGHDTLGAEMSRLRKSLRRFQAVAAVLLAGVIGVSVYTLQILEELKAPRANTISEFVPSDKSVRSSEIEPTLIALPRGHRGNVTLILDGSDIAEYPEYRAEIHRKRGKRLSSVTGLQRQPQDFGLTLRAEELELGFYEIEIYGMEKGSSTLVRKYKIKIEQS